MKLLAGILIAIACTYIGIGYDNYYKSRQTVLKEFATFIDFALAEISYLKTDLIALLEKYNNIKSSRLSQALLVVENPITLCADELKINVLSNADKQLIVAFIKDISRLDIQAQQAFCQQYKLRINARIAEVETQEIKKSGLIKKIAPLLGLALLIIVM